MARAEVRAGALVNWEGTNIQHAHDQRHLPWLVPGSVGLLVSGMQWDEIDNDGLMDEMGLLSVIDSIWGCVPCALVPCRLCSVGKVGESQDSPSSLFVLAFLLLHARIPVFLCRLPKASTGWGRNERGEVRYTCWAT